jgi:hypothetical protein
MKTLTTLAAFLVLSAGVAFAQSESTGSANNSVSSVTPNSTGTTAHDVTGFSNKNTGPGITQDERDRPPNMHPNLKPQPGGVATAIYKHGAVMISPVAPASYGMGEKYLSAPDPQYDVAHEVGPAAHRDSGGFKLFSLEF